MWCAAGAKRVESLPTSGVPPPLPPRIAGGTAHRQSLHQTDRQRNAQDRRLLTSRTSQSRGETAHRPVPPSCSRPAQSPPLLSLECEVRPFTALARGRDREQHRGLLTREAEPGIPSYPLAPSAPTPLNGSQAQGRLRSSHLSLGAHRAPTPGKKTAKPSHAQRRCDSVVVVSRKGRGTRSGVEEWRKRGEARQARGSFCLQSHHFAFQETCSQGSHRNAFMEKDCSPRG